MATYTAVYTGSFGMNSAGTNGRSTTLHGDAIESGKKIISISYTINMSAGGYSSGDYWKVHEFQIAGGPYASAKNVRMTGTRGTVSGEMTFSQSHISAFGGSCSLHAKVNTTHSSTSYMGDVTVTVYYTDDTSSGSSSSSSPSSSSIGTITTDKTSVAAGEEIKFTLPQISSSSEKYWIT